MDSIAINYKDDETSVSSDEPYDSMDEIVSIEIAPISPLSDNFDTVNSDSDNGNSQDEIIDILDDEDNQSEAGPSKRRKNDKTSLYVRKKLSLVGGWGLI